MSPKFRRGEIEAPKSETPERLFDDLPRTRKGVASLWSHQADILRQYHNDHLRTPDVSLELPTGSGKTIPALLIAEWRRTALDSRVVYACPTIQLAHQVHAEATRQGIAAVALHGSHWDWDTAESAKYERGDAVAITTYSTIFNSNPALSSPHTLLFDDAHAAEQYVASAWSVTIRRSDELDLYGHLLRAISDELPGLLLQRLRMQDPDPNTRSDVRLLPVTAMHRRLQAIDAVLASATGDMKYRYTQIRAGLDRCLLYFGWDGFLIRPYIPPTNFHPHFSDAAQRLYISATLGDGGELERAFGRSPILRLPVPPGWEQRSSGRRFFIFPELIKGNVAQALTRSLIDAAQKALVISPSNRQLEGSIATLVPDGMRTFGKGQIEKSLDGFRKADRGVLALANRYDGIDLADDSCRMTVLDGQPSGEHLQERFLIRSLRAGRVLEERLRTRVIQGAGRCTRGLKDHSVVVILSEELTRFLQRREIRSALRPETQAEIAFGISNSGVSISELREAVYSCLEQDDDWQKDAEPYIAELRRDALRTLPPGTDALAASAAKEVKAWNQVWKGDFENASRSAVEAAQLLTDGILSPYRALWLYFAGSWQEIAASQSGNAALSASAKELMRKAHAAAKGTSWLRELAPPEVGDVPVDALDECAVVAAATHPARKMDTAKWINLCNEMTQGLASTEATKYEPALSTLGKLLGAEAFKPPEKGRADSVWIYGQHWWLTVEAKSDAKAEGLVSMENVRQTNSQLRSLSADREAPIPGGSASLIITPKQLVDPDAAVIAEPHVYLSGPGDIQALAQDAIEAWRDIRASATNLEGAEAESVVRQKLADYRLLPTAIRERIADRPISA
ncbi:MAG TPA: DEAD/DEAH box helicase [Acidimicrobiales bacterium]|nr:DEAD/DEAH box helicase [Acidimicrobiales bacterium]